MHSRSLSVLFLSALPLIGADVNVLRVCADPNNLPFSNRSGEGLENRLAELLAHRIGRSVAYTWWSERKNFIEQTLGEDRCDAVMSIPSSLDSAGTTRPYYHSTYVFVSRKDRDLRITSLVDSRFSNWRIGIHVVGDDYAPPAYALAHRGLAANITGFSLFGAYGEPNPPARLLDAVASGDVDVAIVWGPLAGYFAARHNTRFDIAPVSPAVYLGVPFRYGISVGVRKGDEPLRQKLDQALDGACTSVQALLRSYGVPQVAEPEGGKACGPRPPSRAASS